MECGEDLLDWRLVVPAMNLVQVNIIGAQTPKQIFRGIHDVLAREATLIGLVPHRVEDFSRNDILVPPGEDFAEEAARYLLADTLRIHVSRVKEIDAVLRGAPNNRATVLFIENPWTRL